MIPGLPCGGAGCGGPPPSAKAFAAGKHCPLCLLWYYYPDSPVVRKWKDLAAKGTPGTLAAKDPPTPPPGGGPGTELKLLLASLGITEGKSCGCKAFARQMDELGPAGCRENLDHIVGRLRTMAKKIGWLEYAKVAARAVGMGLVLNPLDPYPGLVLEAVRRAEEKSNLRR